MDSKGFSDLIGSTNKKMLGDFNDVPKIHLDMTKTMSPELLAIIIIGVMPINYIIHFFQQQKRYMIKMGKKLNYLKSLRKKSKSHIKEIERIESLLKKQKK